MVSTSVLQFAASVFMITGILAVVIPILFLILAPDLIQATANRESERFATNLTATYLTSIPIESFPEFLQDISNDKARIISRSENDKEEENRIKENKSVMTSTIITASILFAVFGTIAIILFRFSEMEIMPFLTKVVLVSLSAIMIELLFLYYIVGEMMLVNMNAINTTIADYSYNNSQSIRNYWNNKNNTSQGKPGTTTGVSFV